MAHKNSFEQFFGKRVFSGIELGHEMCKNVFGFDEICGVCLFTIDGQTYKLVEDQGDGYRSYCGEIEISDRKPKFQFEGVKVLCRALPNGQYFHNDCMEVIDIKNGKTILIVGTENYDYWYPCCVFKYTPENMSCNEGVSENDEDN